MTRQEMREAIRPLMSEERYRHSLGVEKEAERLARRWGEDPEKAAIGGYCMTAVRKCRSQKHCKS